MRIGTNRQIGYLRPDPVPLLSRLCIYTHSRLYATLSTPATAHCALYRWQTKSVAYVYLAWLNSRSINLRQRWGINALKALGTLADYMLP